MQGETAAYNGIEGMLYGLGIDGGDSIARPALRFYEIAVEKNFTRGRRKEQVQAACLYIACSVLAREEEERIARKLKEEMHSKKVSTAPDPSQKEAHARAKESTEGKGSSVDKEKVLKVSWEKIGEDYTAQKLTELFSEFGEVEDVVIKSSKKKGSALVVMSSKDATKASCGNVLGDLSNPLLIVPLQPVQPPTPSPFFNAEKYEEPEGPSLSNLIGSSSVV
ncbi:hypothetical protein K7X08_008344 [Anisodus acutangulus]|uniref:RRM domain-containing protein n=1 Tax=Anisodus acutangulus TaxID=402998 RepID=A0A9Q1MTH9_9SOLA|nr:hypothetical protein K7X08_008344 [Anisodus acutangulus]